MPNTPEIPQEIHQAFVEYDRRVIINNVKVGCWIGMALMPIGVVLDFFVYRPQVVHFFKLRLLCSLLIAVFWTIVDSAAGRKHPRALGIILAMFPSSFITWMIFETAGSTSPYYAGLNLVLLVIGFVLYWTLVESLIAVSLVMLMYVMACILHGHISTIDFINNLYFLALTGVIVVTGSFVHSRWRFREFALRYQLNQQNEQLDRQNKQIKEAEAQLVQTEKLASLGRMSAGIIHEINNPLNFVKTGLYTLQKHGKHLPAERQADYSDIVKDLEDGFDRVMNIVSSLRSFTHHDEENRDEIPVANLVDESLRFVSHEWSAGVKLEKQLAEGQTIYANKNKLIQVCLNLLENSLDALKTKTFAAGEQPVIRVTSAVENGKSILRFYDNGPGIPPENLGKIFDPFFTTKDVGAGMGMGLSICYRIIQEFNGDIRVQSEPGKYCEFTLEFQAKA